MAETVVMVATSYPRFAGDITGTFMEPIARGLAARGHAVHVVLPWHPKLTRPLEGGGVTLHPFRYAPHPSLNVFGYAEGLKADVALRWTAWASAPLAPRRRHRRGAPPGPRGRRDDRPRPLGRARRRDGGDRRGRTAARRQPARIGRLRRRAPRRGRHGGAADVRPGPLGHRLQRRPARSRDRPGRRRGAIVGHPLRRRRRGLPAATTSARARGRALLGVAADVPLVVTIGRFVKKKGFEYLIDAVPALVARHPSVQVVLAGARRPRGGAAARAPGRRRVGSRPLPRPARPPVGAAGAGGRRRRRRARPSATTPATSTGCPTSSWRRWPRARRWSPRRPAASASVDHRRRERPAGAGAGRRRPRRGHRSAARRPGPRRRAGRPGAQPRAGGAWLARRRPGLRSGLRRGPRCPCRASGRRSNMTRRPAP